MPQNPIGMHIDVSKVHVAGSQPKTPPPRPSDAQSKPCRSAPSHCSPGSITPLPQPGPPSDEELLAPPLLVPPVEVPGSVVPPVLPEVPGMGPDVVPEATVVSPGVVVVVESTLLVAPTVPGLTVVTTPVDVPAVPVEDSEGSVVFSAPSSAHPAGPSNTPHASSQPALSKHHEAMASSWHAQGIPSSPHCLTPGQPAGYRCRGTDPMSSTARFAGLRRRHWLIAAPAGLLALSVAAHRWWGSRSPASTAGASQFPSLRPGTSLGPGTIVRIHPLHLGAVPVVLATAEGHRYQVDVLARDRQGSPGVANTERLSLFVVNSRALAERDGQRPTDEAQGLGVMALAEALVEASPPPGLLTLGERHRHHPDGIFAVPLA